MNSTLIIHRYTDRLPIQHTGLAGYNSSICKCEVEQAQKKREGEWGWVRAAREKEGKEGRRQRAARRAGERTGCSFYSLRCCIVKGDCRNGRIHGDRWQMLERGRRMEEWQLPLRRTIRRRWQNEEAIVVRQMERSVTAPCSCAVAVVVTVLTLVEFTQAARVAEGADSPRLPAAPALHPTLCRPDPTPRSLRRNAALGRYIIPPRGGGAEAATFPVQQCSVHTHIHAQSHTYNNVGSDAGATSCNSYLPLLHCFPVFRKHTHTFTKLGTFAILLHMLPSVQCRLERAGESEWVKQRGDRTRQPAVIDKTTTGVNCFLPSASAARQHWFWETKWQWFVLNKGYVLLKMKSWERDVWDVWSDCYREGWRDFRLTLSGAVRRRMWGQTKRKLQ